TAASVTSVDRTMRMPTPSSAPGSVSRVSSGRETISTPRTLSSSRAPRSILSATRRRMQRATLPEKPPRAVRLVALLAGAAALGGSAASLAGCRSDHHVSPWGQPPDAVLGAYFAE